MYLLMLNYIAPIEKIDNILADHKIFLEKYYSMKKFICSGKRNPRTGGIILCNAGSLNEVNNIIKEDPFKRNGVVEYEVIEFIPTKHAEGFETFLT